MKNKTRTQQVRMREATPFQSSSMPINDAVKLSREKPKNHDPFVVIDSTGRRVTLHEGF